MKSSNYSVREILRIADKYSYKLHCRVIHSIFGDKFYIQASDPFLKSPYPRLIYSVYFGQKFRDKLNNQDII